MCMARLSALLPGPVTVTLLPTFPVIRDQVTDVFDYRTAQRI
jgi:succinate dehydrogenase/fumarate reductase-like Fe-S protein